MYVRMTPNKGAAASATEGARSRCRRSWAKYARVLQLTDGTIPRIKNSVASLASKSIETALTLGDCYFVGQDYLAFQNTFCVTIAYVLSQRKCAPQTLQRLGTGN